MIAQVIDQALEKLLIEVLNMSLTASVMILAVLLARVVLKQVPRIFSYVLWLVVLFRLLCPFSFESEISLLGALQNEPASEGRMEYIPEDIGYQMEPEVNLPVPAMENAVNSSLPAGNPRGSVNPLQIILYLAWNVWLLGIAGMLAYSGVSLFRLRRRLKTAVREQKNLYRFPGTGTPFVYGFFRPRIYLPLELSPQEQEYMLLHEQIHIRRGDHIYRVLAYIALCIHWFNPLVWAAFSLSGKDMEISCDEAVIRKLGSDVKKEYSASLLNVAAGSRIVKGIPLAFGESDTGSRIKHVLRYKKPAKLLVGAAAAVSVILAVVLLANPREDDTAGEVDFIGIVGYADLEGPQQMVVNLSGVGDVRIPEYNKVDVKIQSEFSGLEVGDFIKISFPLDSVVMIQESYPAAFTEAAKRITVLGRGFGMEYEGSDYFLFAFPLEMTKEAVVGDILHIIRDYPEQDSIEDALLASAEILRVDAEAEQIWVELTREEVEWFLAEFDMGMRLELERQVEAETEQGSTAEILDDVKDSWDFEPENIEDGAYQIAVRSIARSARVIDRYVCNAELEELPELAFAEDCTFLVNEEMDRVRYEEVTFEAFAELINDKGEWTNALCYLTIEDGLITQAALKSAHFKYGISYEPYSDSNWLEDVRALPEMEGVDVLKTYYTLVGTENLDVGDSRGTERVEIYTGNIGDGDSGFVIFYNEQGEVLHAEDAHASRAGWNNIYLGEAEGTPYILTVHIEERDAYGGHGYQVYRQGRFGEIQQIAGSFFEFDDGRMPYDDALFRKWVTGLEYYLEHSHLVLSTQEGEIRTEQICELDKYNYETLRRGN